MQRAQLACKLHVGPLEWTQARDQIQLSRLSSSMRPTCFLRLNIRIKLTRIRIVVVHLCHNEFDVVSAVSAHTGKSQITTCLCLFMAAVRRK